MFFFLFFTCHFYSAEGATSDSMLFRSMLLGGMYSTAGKMKCRSPILPSCIINCDGMGLLSNDITPCEDIRDILLFVEAKGFPFLG